MFTDQFLNIPKHFFPLGNSLNVTQHPCLI